MNVLAEFLIYAWLTVGGFFVALGVSGFLVEYIQLHRYERKWCWRMANWLDSL